MKKIMEKIPAQVKTYFKLFSIVFPIWLLISIFFKHWLTSFAEGLLIEAFGMLLEIIFLGIVIVWLNESREKQRRIEKREEEIIDDLKRLKVDEATYKIVGSIRRLNKQGITGINLKDSFLKNADLQRVNLRDAYMLNANLEQANLEEANLEGTQLDSANLSKANLRKANLRRADLFFTDLSGADLKETDLRNATFWDANLEYANLDSAILKDANFREANLEDTRNLSINQLSKVETLFEAKLDPEIEKQIREKYPHLLERPREEE